MVCFVPRLLMTNVFYGNYFVNSIDIDAFFAMQKNKLNMSKIFIDFYLPPP